VPLSSREVDVLQMMAGEREPEFAPWVGACLEVLVGKGLCADGPIRTLITDKGRAALADAKRSQLAAEVMGS